MVCDSIPTHGKHTGKDIASIFYKYLVQYGLEHKIQGITVDNASANTRFMIELQKLLSSFDSENQYFQCMAHIFNLGVQDMLKNLGLTFNDDDEDRTVEFEDPDSDTDNDNDNDDTVQAADTMTDDGNSSLIEDSSNTLMKLRSIISKIRRSKIVYKKFNSACETAGVPTRMRPTLDCPTRWNSTYDMIGTASKLKGGITMLCSITPELSQYKIRTRERFIMEKLYKFLINFENLSEKLVGDKYTTFSLVIVSFNLLLDKIEMISKQLDDKIDRDNADEQLVLGFEAAKNKMLKHYTRTNWIYCSALILDPRHKLKTFNLTPWGRKIKEESFLKFKEIYKKYETQNLPPRQEVEEVKSAEDNEDTID
ncbi:uncharacterized protein LOC130674183 [Microplitis mediator]|uniref:uncharacterized protein LOC130674183 n=1 Tax=Microplitis mediator TaxID=375433 RepID=UPI002556C6D5|nr:uncharacterized protein LOC130674183 [Microplitis mediator]